MNQTGRTGRRNRHMGNRHAGKCQVCKHLDCKAIEAAYQAGESPYELARMFFPRIQEAAAVASIYRHVRMLGLAGLRGRSTLEHLDRFIERLAFVPLKQVTASDIFRAYELRAKLRGELVERRQHSFPGAVILTPEQREKRLEAGLAKFGVVLRKGPPEVGRANNQELKGNQVTSGAGNNGR